MEDDHSNHQTENDHNDHAEDGHIDDHTEGANMDTCAVADGVDITQSNDACEVRETVGLSDVNAEVPSKLQMEDPTLANVRRKSAASSEIVQDDKNAIYWDNGILRRKW